VAETAKALRAFRKVRRGGAQSAQSFITINQKKTKTFGFTKNC